MSEFEVVVAPKAGRPVGPFSQAVKLKPGASLVFCSGALGRNPADKKLPEGVEAQTRQSLANVRNVLEAAGTSMSNVVKATILLSDISDLKAVSRIYAEHFPVPHPARVAYAVATLPAHALVEIEVIAVCPTRSAL
ncbi:MAG: hypothetical protein MHM6MM_001767 [Cercozoa sp. M6MM]